MENNGGVTAKTLPKVGLRSRVVNDVRPGSVGVSQL